MNPYDILGLSVHATDEEIKQRYKQLAQQYHPDKGGDAELFKKIKLAYEILSDPERRKQFDRTGKIHDNISIRDETLEQLSRMFLSTIQEFDPEQGNLVLSMKNETRNLKSVVEKDIEMCTKYINVLEKIISKIKQKKNEENILVQFASIQLQTRTNDLVMLERRIQVCNLMLEVLEDYQYGDDIVLLIHQFQNPQEQQDGGPKG